VFPVSYYDLWDKEKNPPPPYITKEQAIDDIQMLEYLIETSYAGKEYWEGKGVDFTNIYHKLKNFIYAQGKTFYQRFLN
jgi:hypothetical protein